MEFTACKDVFKLFQDERVNLFLPIYIYIEGGGVMNWFVLEGTSKII